MSKPSSLGRSSLEADTDVEQAPITEKHNTTEAPTSETITPWHPSQFPDGGREAWMSLVGASFAMYCSFGWLNCIGAFQAYYQTHQLKDYSPSTVAWISSCEIFVMFVPGPIIGFFIDNYGPRYVLLFGSFFHVFGLMMTSLCTEYWQFVLAQGICSPLGLNAIFNCALASITTWFLKKRGAAFGIAAAGSGLGGVTLPIMVSHLIPSVGYAWTMRIAAFLILGLLIIANLTLKSRLPPVPRKFEVAVFYEPFKDLRFIILTTAGLLTFFGLFVPINFIEVQAVAGGMSTSLANYLIPVLNSTSIFGRIIPGILADKLGRFNLQMVMSGFSGVLVLAFGLCASSNAAFITYAALYGFASGAFVSLAPAQIAFISKVEQIGVRQGVLFSVLSFAGLVGSPIAGAIVKSENGGFNGTSIFAGVMLLAGAAVFVLARMHVARWKLFAKI
ncbi:MFS general substrate transporter [Polyplosphaeria fusca]|uniref:MFS general substrate transporter n=1 Tax=Polyplosphaeria fusca TaxID=682080 RepID=A0A9P4V614_9PLEO|nr:MFS general substrate transporter [Polyplosphaeria fusca]